jgi:hypothetical protein
MACEKHGYTNGVFCPACDRESADRNMSSNEVSIRQIYDWLRTQFDGRFPSMDEVARDFYTRCNAVETPDKQPDYERRILEPIKVGSTLFGVGIPLRIVRDRIERGFGYHSPLEPSGDQGLYCEQENIHDPADGERAARLR